MEWKKYSKKEKKSIPDSPSSELTKKKGPKKGSRASGSMDRNVDETKRGKAQPVANPKQQRHLSVVGGESSTRSLRELRHHRNKRKQTQKRAQSTAAADRSKSDIPVIREKKRVAIAPKKPSVCDMCTKVQVQWIDSDGLRKKSVYSDVVLRASDDEYFYCNSSVLGLWSKTVLDRAQCVAIRGEEEWVIDMDTLSGEILHSALRFMYGGTVIDLPPTHLSEIVNMADAYQMEHLKRACFAAAALVPLKTESACSVWTFADEYNLGEATKRAMLFVYTNLEKMVASPDWSRVSHRPDMLVKLLDASTEWTVPNEDFRSSKMEDDSSKLGSFTQGLRAIWKESSELSREYAYSDKVIVAKTGRQFHVHSQIIHASAPAFAAFLEAETETTDMNLIYMDDMDDDVVLEFLRYMYRQEPSSAFPNLAPLVHVLASTYEVQDLTRRCERETAIHEIKTVDGALRMLREAEEHRMSAAKSSCFRYLYTHLAEVRVREDWRKLVFDEPQLLTEMMLESKRFRTVVVKE